MLVDTISKGHACSLTLFNPYEVQLRQGQLQNLEPHSLSVFFKFSLREFLKNFLVFKHTVLSLLVGFVSKPINFKIHGDFAPGPLCWVVIFDAWTIVCRTLLGAEYLISSRRRRGMEQFARKKIAYPDTLNSMYGKKLKKYRSPRLCDKISLRTNHPSIHPPKNK